VKGKWGAFGEAWELTNKKQSAPFGIDILVSAPTLFMGVGAFIWIPLTVAVGRRPVFLLATLVITMGTFWAGMTKNFYALLAAVCLIGLAEGFGTSAVSLRTGLKQEKSTD
jgi:MFS family permease